jgi:uncharacterized membrane protein YgcG
MESFLRLLLPLMPLPVPMQRSPLFAVVVVVAVAVVVVVVVAAAAAAAAVAVIGRVNDRDMPRRRTRRSCVLWLRLAWRSPNLKKGGGGAARNRGGIGLWGCRGKLGRGGFERMGPRRPRVVRQERKVCLTVKR